MSFTDPKIWGPKAWDLLHRLSFCITDDYTANQLFKSLVLILPCCTCRDNLAKHMKALPLTKSTAGFSMWVFDIHNMINKSTGATEANPAILKKYSRECRLQKSDVVFLRYVIKAHPGSRKVSKEYIEALQIFLNIVCKYSNVKMCDVSVLRYRSQLNHWLTYLLH